MVVSGPRDARNMAEALEICYDAVPDPRILVACGTEASLGRALRRKPRRGPHVLRPPHPRSVASGRTHAPHDLHRRHDDPAGHETQNAMLRLRTIFLSFFRIGLFTFGGGYAMLPLIERAS